MSNGMGFPRSEIEQQLHRRVKKGQVKKGLPQPKETCPFNAVLNFCSETRSFLSYWKRAEVAERRRVHPPSWNALSHLQKKGINVRNDERGTFGAENTRLKNQLVLASGLHDIMLHVQKYRVEPLVETNVVITRLTLRCWRPAL